MKVELSWLCEIQKLNTPSTTNILLPKKQKKKKRTTYLVQNIENYKWWSIGANFGIRRKTGWCTFWEEHIANISTFLRRSIFSRKKSERPFATSIWSQKIINLRRTPVRTQCLMYPLQQTQEVYKQYAFCGSKAWCCNKYSGRK